MSSNVNPQDPRIVAWDGQSPVTYERTDHSAQIANLRESCTIWEQAHADTGSAMFKEMALQGRAAADLLEIHDATGLNLHQAPNLLAFVEHILGSVVEDNGA